MGEHEIQASLDLYNVQLEQVVLALAVTTEESARADLTKLQSDLTELIVLTEESLLNAKKAKLLSMLDDSTTSSHESEGRRTSVPSQGDAMDAEFAAFQAAIGGETSSGDVLGPETSSSSRQTVTAQMGDDPATSSTAGAEDDVDFSEIVGTKCRVWFNQDWGQSGWHNCMVLSAEPLHPDKPPAVRVLFCNPVHRRMLPCPFFMEDRCRFSDEECRFSHGHKVLVEDLEEFEDPDYSALCMECRCLARYEEDDLWYKAIIVDVLADHKYTVMYDNYEDTATLDVEDLLPLPDSEGSSSGSDSEGGEMAGMEDEDEAMPVYLWRPPKTTDALGEWEKHTKGIGSKLMAKMGYISGQGLGKNSEGRAEPVPIQLLPQGKSLDKIMELKEKAGDQDLYDVMKKHKRKHKKNEAKAAKGYDIKNESHSVFDFLNNRLGKKKGNVKDLVKHSHATKTQKTHISEKDLNEKSDRHLNIQIFQTHEELKNVDKELSKLQESLKRNNSGSTTTMKIKQKISSLESYRNQLKHSEHSIQKHRTKRNDKKKMTVF